MKKENYILYENKHLFTNDKIQRIIKIQKEYSFHWLVDWIYYIDSNFLDKHSVIVPKSYAIKIIKKYNNIQDIINDFPNIMLS